MNIRKATTSDVYRIVKTHCDAFKGFFLSKISSLFKNRNEKTTIMTGNRKQICRFYALNKFAGDSLIKNGCC